MIHREISATGPLYIISHTKGKIVIVNFVSWCVLCRTELPELFRLRKELPEAEVLIVGAIRGRKYPRSRLFH
ncbi:hypothetical protein DSUL_120002 [Desulfovibrionales bacterium]